MPLDDFVESTRGYMSGWLDRRTVRLRGVRVFCYHGVVERKVDSRVERNQHLLSSFTKQVNYLRRFRILGLPELLDEMALSVKPKAPAAVITFDDATASSLMAAEVLDRGKMPWILFAPAGEVGVNRAMWTVDLSLLMLYGARDNIEVRGRVWSLSGREAREGAFQFLRHQLKSLPAADRREAMDSIRAQFPPGESSRLVEQFPSFRMLTWREIVQLSAAGVEIGSHGLYHEIHHDRQPEDIRRSEVVDSRALIERETGRPCHAFAFPNGNFVPESPQDLRAAGYTLAFTTRPGTIDPTSDPFLLPRVSAPGSLVGFARHFWWEEAAAADTRPMVSGGAVTSTPEPGPPLDSRREYYNERWKDYEFANSLKLARAAAILDGLAATRIREPRILDLGCGTGWLTAILGTFGPTLGVELSDEAVRAAAQRYNHIELVAGDLFRWSCPREAFDIVVSQEVIEHVPDQTGYVRIAHEALRHGGYLILTTPNAETLEAMTPEQRSHWSNQPVELPLSRRELRALLEPHFRIVRLTTIIPNYGVSGARRVVNSARFRRTLGRVGLGPAFDRWRLGTGYGLHTVVVAEKP